MIFSLEERTRRIKTGINGRQLCWFGVRGVDAPPLARYGRLSHIYSQTAPLYQDPDIYEKSIETVMMHRVDLNTYDIDFDEEHHSREFKRTILFGLKNKIILTPYRPQECLSSIYFTHADIISYFGLFHKFQRTFEHKPWVENSLKEAGINVIPWEYVQNIERDMVRARIDKGKTILIRPPYSSGGAGYAIIRNIEDIYTNPVSSSNDGFFSVAPFFEDAIPLNINGCIYRDGNIQVFLPSFQLIGVKESTNRHLGYCGNDFGAVKPLEEKFIDEIERVTLNVGSWLAKKEYLGIFGADLLISDGQVYLVEINPRFQGSTLLSSLLAWRIGDPDPYGEHLAAFLGLTAPTSHRLWHRVKQMDAFSQLIIYNKLPRPVSMNVHSVDLPEDEYKGLPKPHVTVAPEGMILKKMFQHSITSDGYRLLPDIAPAINKILAELIR